MPRLFAAEPESHFVHLGIAQSVLCQFCAFSAWKGSIGLHAGRSDPLKHRLKH
jgi:hypothetical protein